MVRQMMLGLRSTGATVVEYATDDHREALDTEGRRLRPRDDRPGLAEVGGPRGADRARAAAPRGVQRGRPELPARGCAAPARDGVPPRHRPQRPRRLRARDAPHRGQLRRLPHQCAGLRAAVRGPGRAQRRPSRRHQRRVLPSRSRRGPSYACEVLVLAPAASGPRGAGQGAGGRLRHPRLRRGLGGARRRGPRAHLRRRRPRRAQLGPHHRRVLPHRGRARAGQGGAVRLSRRGRPGGHQPLPRGRALPRPTARRSSASRPPTTSCAKVRYYLDHPAEADAIREAGRARVLRDHTWRTAWPRVLEELRR